MGNGLQFRRQLYSGHPEQAEGLPVVDQTRFVAKVCLVETGDGAVGVPSIKVRLCTLLLLCARQGKGVGHAGKDRQMDEGLLLVSSCWRVMRIHVVGFLFL